MTAYSCASWTIALGGDGALSLSRGGQNLKTRLVAIKNGVSPRNTQQQMFDLRLTERAGDSAELLDIQSEAERLTARAALGEGFELEYIFAPNGPLLEMTAVLRYDGKEPQRLRFLEWTVEGAEEKDYPRMELFGPGTMPCVDEPIDLHRRLDRWQSDNIISHIATSAAPYNSSGVMGCYDAERRAVQATWFLSDFFACATDGLYRRGRLTRVSRITCPRMMRRGDEETIGRFVFLLDDCARDAAVRQVAESFKTAHWDKDNDEKALRAINLLEVFVGEKSNRTLSNTFDELADKMEEIRDMGFNAIEVMPAFPWPSYSVVDFQNVPATYRDADGLRRLIERAHECGLKVVFDMVFHGPRDFTDPRLNAIRSPLLDAHPDWFARTEHGTFAKTYTRSFDLSNPDYQRYIADSMIYYLDEWRADGFRLDAQDWNFFPNWDETTGRMPYEMLLAGYRMMENIRARVLKEHPHAFFYTEARAPGAGNGHEYRYNYDYHWLYPSLCRVVDPRGMAPMVHNYGSENTMSWADAALWCAENAAIQPRGVVTMQQVDSHDSAEWSGYVGGQFNREAFGGACYEVLFTLAALLGGGMMALYTSYEGHEAYVSAVLKLRLNAPVFRYGDCRHTALSADDRKTACLFWTHEGDAAMFVGNLADEDKTVTVRLERGAYPADTPVRLRDMITGDALGDFAAGALEEGVMLRLEPFEKHIFDLERI